MRTKLSEAWQRYSDHEERGDDMAEAGAELAGVVEQILEGPTCGMPRAEYLREMEAVSYEDGGELIDNEEAQPGEQDPSPPDDYGYKDYRP